MSLKQYFQEAFDKGVIDHSLRVQQLPGGDFHFYIHPASVDGDTEDFRAKDGDLVRPCDGNGDGDLTLETSPYGPTLKDYVAACAELEDSLNRSLEERIKIMKSALENERALAVRLRNRLLAIGDEEASLT